MKLKYKETIDKIIRGFCAGCNMVGFIFDNSREMIRVNLCQSVSE